MRSDDFELGGTTRYPVGLKAQVGGGIAIFLGVLLLVFLPVKPPGPGLDLHQMAKVFIGIGVFLLAAGTVGRWMAD